MLAIKKINREHWLILTFLGGDKDEGDADHMESLSRPVSGERTSSHDDNESVGSVRPASGASGSITGKYCCYCDRGDVEQGLTISASARVFLLLRESMRP